MFISPSLSLSEIEDMTIQEITERIEYQNNLVKKRKTAESKDFFNILTNSIAVGYNYGKCGKKKVIEDWEKSLNRIFSNSDEKKELNTDKEVEKIKKIFG